MLYLMVRLANNRTMKIRILKKNNKPLFSKRGKGFYGRVFVLGIDDHHIVLQHINGRPRTHAVMTYCDVDLFQEISKDELLINAVQRHYLKKYGFELEFIKSSVSLPQFSERDGAYWLELAPINNQQSIDFGEDTEVFGAIVGKIKGATSILGLDTDGAGRKSAHVKADGVRNRERQPAAQPEHVVRPVRQLELAI